MKTPRTQAGLKRLHHDFGVPFRPEDLAPHMRDLAPGRGPLSQVPREPIARVMDFGGSAASARVTIGRVTRRAQQTDTRFPAHQITGSTQVTP